MIPVSSLGSKPPRGSEFFSVLCARKPLLKFCFSHGSFPWSAPDLQPGSDLGSQSRLPRHSPVPRSSHHPAECTSVVSYLLPAALPLLSPDTCSAECILVLSRFCSSPSTPPLKSHRFSSLRLSPLQGGSQKNPALPEILSIATSALPHSLPSLSPRALKSCCTCCSADAPDTVPLPCAPSRLASSAENRRTPALAQRPAAPAAALGRYGGRNVRWQKP